MKYTFSDLVSGHGFERYLGQHFEELPDLGIDYRHVYSGPENTPFLRIDLDNRQNMSRITLHETGQCRLETVSFKDSTPITTEDLALDTPEAFEAKLLGLIEYMKETLAPH